MTCKETKYLGHFISDDLNDDRDIYRRCSKLYAQANIFLKCSLSKAFCTPQLICGAAMREVVYRGSLWPTVVQ